MATVQIYDLEPNGQIYPVGNAVLTDMNGYFNSGSILNDDGPGEDGLDIVVGIFASSPVANVINPTNNYPYYNLTTTVWSNSASGTLDIGNLNVRYDQRGAWWIFSWPTGLTQGWYYLLSTVGYNTPVVTCRWPYGSYPVYWTNGTIDLVDWACWWPDIILHEYGHHVMCSLYGYLPPSVENHFMNLRNDSTTAWTEGWADFFPLAVFGKSTFVLGINATHGVVYDLEGPYWYSSGWDDGDEVEGRVAGALLDIFDSHNDMAPWYYDSFSDGFSRIWNIMHTTLCDTFLDFWHEWYANGYPKQPALMAIFQNSIDYRGPGDANADTHVNLFDAVIVARASGTNWTMPGFDKRADLNNDDVVNILDADIVAANAGKTYDC